MSITFPGRVVRIRISPKDCMGCVDVARKIDAATPGISFAQLVSVTLASALESFRQNGVIPVRDGFEYSEMMQPFKDQPHLDRAKKLQITKALVRAQFEERSAQPVIVDPARHRLVTKYEELAFKSSADPTNMSDDEQQELVKLTNVLFPDPDLTNTK